MHLGGNRRWVPLSFENNNKKRYRGNKFFITIFSIQLHSRGQNLPFPLRWKILVLPRYFGQHIVE